MFPTLKMTGGRHKSNTWKRNNPVFAPGIYFIKGERQMKKLNLLSLPLLAMSMMAFGGCSNNAYSIGVLFPVEHDALKLAATGFKEALVDAGLVEGKDFSMNEKNAGGDEAALQTMAKDLVISSSMTLGLGTGASKALQSAAVDNGKTNPVLFTAVTDPVGAKLVESAENGSGFVTGASDAQPISLQLGLIKEIIPDADKIGIIYTQSEENSVVQANQAEAIAKSLGLEVVRGTVTGPSDIASQANYLAGVSDIDALYVPTDNNIAANMNAIKEACNTYNVLSICGEFGEVKSGGHISYSFDYEMLGKETGKLAVDIIKNGKQAKELPVVFMDADKCVIKYSEDNLKASGITLPQSVLDKAEKI